MSWPRGKRWRRFCGSDPCCWDWPRTHGNESQLESRRSNCLASGRCRSGWPRTAGLVRGHSLGRAAIPETAKRWPKPTCCWPRPSTRSRPVFPLPTQAARDVTGTLKGGLIQLTRITAAPERVSSLSLAKRPAMAFDLRPRRDIMVIEALPGERKGDCPF
jgi:hypothetical protein